MTPPDPRGTAPTPDDPDRPAGNPADDFELDVERIHRTIYRELSDPEEGWERAPWWIWATAVLAVFWGGWYLGRFGGTFDVRTHVALLGREPFTAREANEKVAEAELDPATAGRAVYEKSCQSCHQQNGQGVPGAFPPLVGSEWVTGPAETVVRIVLHGLQGPIEVRGVTYNGAMPAWKDLLSDAEIAAVTTRIRQWPPNRASPVPPAQVTEIRAAHAARNQPWTAAELRAAAKEKR